MPTVNSKLKSALHEELNKASMAVKLQPLDQITEESKHSIERLIDVCEKR